MQPAACLATDYPSSDRTIGGKTTPGVGRIEMEPPLESESRERYHALNFFNFLLIAILVGLVAGLGAFVFRALIAFFHNLLFLGKFSFAYDANLHTAPTPWGIGVILVPVLGAAGVVFLVKNFAPEAKGHGVPEVMNAIFYTKGKIRPIVAVVKSLASALSIGSGGSIGREGPIIQIGSSFGSTVAQLLKISIWQRITLIAAGAAAGIAATFNTPVGGILFAVEILLHEVSARTLVPVTIATATATYVGRMFFGAHPSFIIPQLEKTYFHLTNPWVLISYIGLGLLTGLVSALYIKSIYGFEDFFDRRVKGGYYVRHLSGMLMVGILMYLLMRRFGHYYIDGVGYATVQDVLSGSLRTIPLLLLLFVLKLLATSLTLGSGASGGIFSPGLFMGVTLGGAYGVFVGWLFPALGVSPAAFAVAGMAGIIGGSTGAALAAIVMIFEMTLDYTVIIPMTITVALSYGIRILLSPQSIYTLKLARRGHDLPTQFLSNFHLLLHARDIMRRDMEVLSAASPLSDYGPALAAGKAPPVAVIEASGLVTGILGQTPALRRLALHDGDAPVGGMADTRYRRVTPDISVLDMVQLMRTSDVAVLLVFTTPEDASVRNLVGIIDKDCLFDAMQKPLDLLLE
jgi:chloride channel protein, CIC family